MRKYRTEMKTTVDDIKNFLKEALSFRVMAAKEMKDAMLQIRQRNVLEK